MMHDWCHTHAWPIDDGTNVQLHDYGFDDKPQHVFTFGDTETSGTVEKWFQQYTFSSATICLSDISIEWSTNKKQTNKYMSRIIKSVCKKQTKTNPWCSHLLILSILHLPLSLLFVDLNQCKLHDKLTR